MFADPRRPIHAKWREFEWLRPREFAKGEEARIFSDGYTPDDIKQGALGDCWSI